MASTPCPTASRDSASPDNIPAPGARIPAYRTEIDVAAPANAVWALLAAVTSWPSWTPTVATAEALDAPELAPGYRYRLTQPKLAPAVWTVTALEPGRAFTWQSEGPGLRTIAAHTLTPLPTGGARVELSVEFAGLMSWLAGLLGGSLTRSYIAQEAAALKARAEGGA